jgi:hypothetical protein
MASGAGETEVTRRWPSLTMTQAALLIAFACIVALALFAWNGSNERHRICTVIDELVAETIGDADGDGEPDRPPTDLRLLLGTPQYQALDPANQAMWNLVITATSSNDGGPSTRERIQRFAEGCG